MTTDTLSPERRAALRRLAEEAQADPVWADPAGREAPSRFFREAPHVVFAREIDPQTILALLDAADQAEAAEQRAVAATRWSALWKRAARFNLRTRRPLEKHAMLRLQQMAEHQSVLESEHAAALRQAEAWRRRAERFETELRSAWRVGHVAKGHLFLGYETCDSGQCPMFRRMLAPMDAALADDDAREGGGE